MKLLVGFVTSVLVAATLSLGFAAPAQARCDQYGPCIDTDLRTWSKKNPIRAKNRARFSVRLVAEDGRTPDARLRVRAVRRGNGKVVWSGNRVYNGGRQVFRTGRLPRGRFFIISKAVPASDRYQNDRDRFGQRVIKKKRRR